MKTTLWMAALLGLTLLLAACTEPPAAPAPNSEAAGLIALTVPAVCEKTWAYASNGNWSDQNAWLPAGAPSSTDEVCITSPGTYTITLTSLSVGDSVYIGPGVSVTLYAPFSTGLIVDEELVIDAGAGAVFSGAAWVTIRDVINDGSLAFIDDTQGSVSARVVNRGDLELDSSWLMFWGGLLNTGVLRVETVANVVCSGLCEFAGGEVAGSGTLRVSAAGSVSGTVVWSGGTLGQRGADTNPARVFLDEISLTLANTALDGAIDLSSDVDTIFGDIGAAVNVKLRRYGSGSARLFPLPGAPPGTPVVNHGTILVDGTSTLPADRQTIDGTAALVNRGTIAVLSVATDLTVGTFDNHGIVTAQSDLTLGAPSQPTVTRNFGTISVDPGAVLVQRDGTFYATSSGSQTGRLRLAAGVLSGGGHAGDVDAHTGSIAPGPGIQTLSLDRLVLSPTSTVQMEVVNPVTMDRLRVLGAATYDGRLEVTSLGSYVGGVCGQLLPMFTDHNSASGQAPGRFRSFANVPGGTGRDWRAHYPIDSVIVAGFEPTIVISTTRSTALLPEGGPAAAGHVCLNVPITGVEVSASLNAVGGQFSASPATMTFTSTNFALPQPVRYTAVDDTLSEGPHSDTLTFALVQAGGPFGSAPPRVPFGIADNDAADLSIAVVAAQTAAPVGQNVDARLRITNLGPIASSGSVLSIPALAGLTYLSSGSATPCAVTAGTLNCTVGPLAVGASTDVLILFNAPAVGVWNNAIRIRGTEWDNVLGNNGLGWALSVY